MLKEIWRKRLTPALFFFIQKNINLAKVNSSLIYKKHFFCSAGNYKQLADIQTYVIIFSTKIKNNYQVVKIFEMVKVISNLFFKKTYRYKHHLWKKIRMENIFLKINNLCIHIYVSFPNWKISKFVVFYGIFKFYFRQY